MMTRDDIIAFELQEEGGFVDNPADPGGATNFGITQRYLTAAIAAHPELNLPATVQELNSAEAAELYRLDEWSEIHGDQLPPGVALLVMDTAVNSSPAEAVRILQHALQVTVDGVIGPATIAAACAANQEHLEDEFCAQHAKFFADLDQKEQPFEVGWMRRLIKAHRVVVSS